MKVLPALLVTTQKKDNLDVKISYDERCNMFRIKINKKRGKK